MANALIEIDIFHLFSFQPLIREFINKLGLHCPLAPRRAGRRDVTGTGSERRQRSGRAASALTNAAWGRMSPQLHRGVLPTEPPARKGNH